MHIPNLPCSHRSGSRHNTHPQHTNNAPRPSLALSRPPRRTCTQPTRRTLPSHITQVRPRFSKEYELNEGMLLPPDPEPDRPLHYQPGTIPDSEVWGKDLLEYRGIFRDRTRPYAFQVILDLAYVHNTPATQKHYRSLTRIQMARILQLRYDAEKSLHSILNSLKTFHRRISALHRYTTADRGVVDDELIRKEREALAILREKIRATRTMFTSARSKCGVLGDTEYIRYSKPLLALITQYQAFADALLQKHIRHVVAHSKVNAVYNKAVSAVNVADPASSAYVRTLEANWAEQARELGTAPMDPIDGVVVAYTTAALTFRHFKDVQLEKVLQEVGRDLLPVMEIKGMEPPDRVWVGDKPLPSRKVLLDKVMRLERFWPEDFGDEGGPQQPDATRSSGARRADAGGPRRAEAAAQRRQRAPGGMRREQQAQKKQQSQRRG